MVVVNGVISLNLPKFLHESKESSSYSVSSKKTLYQINPPMDDV